MTFFPDVFKIFHKCYQNVVFILMFPKHFGNVIKNDIEIVLKTLTKNYIYISVYNLVQMFE